MAGKNSIILIEFNELSPVLMRRFMSEGKLPHFQRLHNQSHVYVTDAAEKAPCLEPWIQWTTVHTGLPYDEHQIFHLGDGHKLKAKRLWDFASSAGLPVWVCGSMNAHCTVPINGSFLPDPWASESRPTPDSLATYFRFVQTNVLEHTNDRVPLRRSDYLKFLRFMVANGLSLSTVSATLRQLASERGGRNHWRRAVLLDKLQFDIFSSIHKKLKPRLATFFSNSTAHFQHRYWRHMEPGVFKIQPSAEEVAEFETAILFGYQEMDKLIGRFLRMTDENTTLVLVTALSQQPCLIYEDDGGKLVHRPRDFGTLLKFVGVSAPHSLAPVMSEEFYVRFSNESDARDAAERLRALHVDGETAMRVDLRESSVFSGCAIFHELPSDAKLGIKGRPDSMPFRDVFYRLEALKSGMHHPDGILWIRKPDCSHQVYSERVPLTSVAPTVLDLLEIPRPSNMRADALRFAA
jgi:hypothetical protein